MTSRHNEQTPNPPEQNGTKQKRARVRLRDSRELAFFTERTIRDVITGTLSSSEGYRRIMMAAVHAKILRDEQIAARLESLEDRFDKMKGA